MGRRAFTVAEANETIPILSGILAELDGKKATAGRLSERLQILEAMWGDGLDSPSNPDRNEFDELRHQMDDALEEISALVEHEILGRGLRFPPGGLANGLIDFPTTFEGRWVFLCWLRGEPEVVHWHEIDAGFRGRQPVCAEHHIAMGRVDDPDQIDDSRLDS